MAASSSLALPPVVTRRRQAGIRASSAPTSVGSRISRKASEALSFRRRTAVAVSKKASPRSAQNASIRSRSKPLRPSPGRNSNHRASPKWISPWIRQKSLMKLG